jgi:hypothetical protein
MRILERWGSREAFVQEKATALPALQEEIASWVRGPGAAAVIESTGLSDGPFLDRLEREFRVFAVRLDVSEDVALARVAARARGRHLSDEAAANRTVWRAYTTEVVPRRRVDLVIDSEATSPEEAARQIAAAAGGPGPGSG